MNTIGERVQYIRKELNGLSRKAFGESLGVGIDEIANIELGRLRNIDQKEPLFKLMCSEYDINYEWLKTGSGDPQIVTTPDEEVLDFLEKTLACDDDDFKKRFILAMSKLDESQWAVLETFINNLVKK